MHHIGVGCKTILAEIKKKLILHAVDASQNGATEWTFFTGHRYICSLPKNIPRISEGDFFYDRHRKQTEEISTKTNLLSSWGLGY